MYVGRKGIFFSGWISWGWKRFLSFSHIAKHSACVQLWISTNLAILNQWADGVPKVHLQVCLAQRAHLLVETMSQVGDGFPSQPTKFRFSNFSEYLLKSYQEPSVGNEMASWWWGKPDAIPGSEGLTCKVRDKHVRGQCSLIQSYICLSVFMECPHVLSPMFHQETQWFPNSVYSLMVDKAQFIFEFSVSITPPTEQLPIW